MTENPAESPATTTSRTLRLLETQRGHGATGEIGLQADLILPGSIRRHGQPVVVAVLLLMEGDAKSHGRSVASLGLMNSTRATKFSTSTPIGMTVAEPTACTRSPDVGPLAELRRSQRLRAGKRRRVNDDARLEHSLGFEFGQRPDLELGEGECASFGGVFCEESGSSEYVATVPAGGEIELADEPFVEREIPGIASRDELDGVGTRGIGVEINHRAPVITAPSPSLETRFLGIDDQPELLFATAIRKPMPMSHISRAGSGFANSARGIEIGDLDPGALDAGESGPNVSSPESGPATLGRSWRPPATHHRPREDRAVAPRRARSCR